MAHIKKINEMNSNINNISEMSIDFNDTIYKMIIDLDDDMRDFCMKYVEFNKIDKSSDTYKKIKDVEELISQLHDKAKELVDHLAFDI